MMESLSGIVGASFQVIRTTQPRHEIKFHAEWHYDTRADASCRRARDTPTVRICRDQETSLPRLSRRREHSSP